MNNSVKVFISQIMKDVPEDLIKEVREKIENGIIDLLKAKGYEAIIIDSYISIEVPETVDRRIYYLGESIKLLSDADLVLIPKTPIGEFPGVKSEADVAVNYDLPMFFYEFDKNNEIVFFNTRGDKTIHNVNKGDYLWG
jgi:hypothetical protein